MVSLMAGSEVWETPAALALRGQLRCQLHCQLHQQRGQQRQRQQAEGLAALAAGFLPRQWCGRCCTLRTLGARGQGPGRGRLRLRQRRERAEQAPVLGWGVLPPNPAP